MRFTLGGSFVHRGIAMIERKGGPDLYGGWGGEAGTCSLGKSGPLILSYGTQTQDEVVIWQKFHGVALAGSPVFDPGRRTLWGPRAGAWMMDPLSRMERNRKEAAKFFDLSKTATSPFLRDYYWCIAERYLLLEDDWRPSGRQGSISKQGGLSSTSAAERFSQLPMK
jgi:hypothetical protein